jgi:hypothetical protein
MKTTVRLVEREELFALVNTQKKQIIDFVNWAKKQEANNKSMYLVNRDDIAEARNIVELFKAKWWGIVVYTCFGSVNSTQILCKIFADPIDAAIAKKVLDDINFTQGKMVGHHRIQPGLAGAKKALVAACLNKDILHKSMHMDGTFDERYKLLISSGIPYWGRTTCFDLLLRTGALGIGDQVYEPEIAYLAGSTGPKKGFRLIWGLDITEKNTPWCEGLLQAWHRHWFDVIAHCEVDWKWRPYAPGDLENALCIYQEHVNRRA